MPNLNDLANMGPGGQGMGVMTAQKPGGGGPGLGNPFGVQQGSSWGQLMAGSLNDLAFGPRQVLHDYYASVQGRTAPQASYSDFRGNQQDLVQRLDALSRGQGPSLAAQQFQQATDRNQASQQAMANSGRGGPMAALTAANNMQMLGAQAAQGSAIARTGEELGALSQLGGVIGQGRGQDEQMNLANMEAKLRMMGLNDSAIQAIIAGLGANKAQSQAAATGDQILSGGANLASLGLGQMGQGKVK